MGEKFRIGLKKLLDLGSRSRCVIMCAEAVWWRCHRRIIADYLLASGSPVFHILGRGRIEQAHITPGAILGSRELLATRLGLTDIALPRMSQSLHVALLGIGKAR